MCGLNTQRPERDRPGQNQPNFGIICKYLKPILPYFIQDQAGNKEGFLNVKFVKI